MILKLHSIGTLVKSYVGLSKMIIVCLYIMSRGSQLFCSVSYLSLSAPSKEGLRGLDHFLKMSL